MSVNLTIRMLLVAVLCVANALSLHGVSPYIQSGSNPWPDDYRHVADMDSCRMWGTYNVHDPSCLRVGDWYYMYSTDAIYRQHGKMPGYIQMRRSQNLVDWEFLGWAFESIPAEAVEWVRSKNHGEGATNIWAPYIIQAPSGMFRLYYCVSAFGKNTSYIGLAESASPAGPWELKGCVVRTDASSAMNAIDPSVICGKDGRWWMHYGSYFGGLYCVELDPATGLALTAGDQGHLTARRADFRKDNLEAPEIFYSPEHDTYYLFQSYDPLMTTYNVRVGRSKSPEGPFTDYFGKEMSDTTNNFPILTAPYCFEYHPGWVGTGHCCVFADPSGKPFMAHQGRYAVDAGMMNLHVRRIFFTNDGWPVVSPERYVPAPERAVSAGEIPGTWEIVRITEPHSDRNLEAGQILWGEGDLIKGEWNLSGRIRLVADGDDWKFSADKQSLSLRLGNEIMENLIIFAGYDWELGRDTILFTGLDSNGRSIWGKRVS